MKDAMKRTEEYIEDTLKRIEQLEHQRHLKKRREDMQKSKDDIRRYIIIGRLVCKYFPDMMKCKPQHNDADNTKEFSDLEETLAFLAGNTEFLAAEKKRDMEYVL